MNLQDELKALKEIVAGYDVLKQRISKLEEQEQEFPQDGDKYWFMSDSGGAIDTSFYSNYYIDNDRIDIGNFFKGREQAEFAVEKLKVEAELRKFSKPFERGSLNFIMCFDVEENKLYSETRRFMNQGSLYFDWGQVARAIETVGKDRIKKYIFGVED